MWEITTFFMTLVSPATETTNRSLPVLWKRGKNCVPLKGGKDPLAGRGFARLSAHVHFWGQKSPHFSIIHEIDIDHIGQFTGGLVEMKEDETS